MIWRCDGDSRRDRVTQALVAVQPYAGIRRLGRAAGPHGAARRGAAHGHAKCGARVGKVGVRHIRDRRRRRRVFDRVESESSTWEHPGTPPRRADVHATASDPPSPLQICPPLTIPTVVEWKGGLAATVMSAREAGAIPPPQPSPHLERPPRTAAATLRR
uniref:Uncharacterized protein n=1 Tax=Oryza glumipatula TaxID=40148 RepID=A0A0E0B132_9ORYZ